MLVHLLLPLALAAEPLHHDLEVTLDPGSHLISATDTLTPGASTWTFFLHAGLAPEVRTEGWSMRPGEVDAEEAGVPLETWTLVRGAGAPEAVTLAWAGPIDHPIAQVPEEYQRSFAETPGIIGEDGAVLGGAAVWVPTEPGRLVTWDLTVTGLQGRWGAVSAGTREKGEDGAVHWTMPHPTEEVWLVAGPWHEWRQQAGEVEVLVFLREDDPSLARRYLDATDRYLRMYEAFLPDYPFGSFALVENFWETGYGMPGFTLLGPQVIRFPWILTSSYPHELLHNWWGNGVYPEWEEGNWTEGLTAYLADHLLSEQKGQGVRHRRDTLKRYTDYVSEGEDFPLVEFRSRHSASTEAVGYGKSLMLFHMARRRAGDEAFAASLSRFYTDNAFSRASWADLEAAFEAETGEDWTKFFRLWTTRAGAPELSVHRQDVFGVLRETEDGATTETWRLELELRQVQPGKRWPLTVPVAITVEGADAPVWREVELHKRKASLSLELEHRPLRVDVDPAVDVMRRLHPMEVEPTVGTIMGEEQVFFVLPAGAPEEEQRAWEALAEHWAPPGAANIVLDSDLAALPPGPTWVLGWTNVHGPAVAERLAAQGVTQQGLRLTVGERTLGHADSSVVVARDPDHPEVAAGWVAAPAAAIPGLSRKLPHYGRYGHLAFEGDAPDNVDKGQWAPVASPLTRILEPGTALPGIEREPITPLPPVVDPQRLLDTATALSDPELEGRGLGSEGLERATAMVEARLEELGLEPAGDEGYRQSFMGASILLKKVGEPPLEEHPKKTWTLTNLVARVPGTEPDLAPVLVMAHLDHLGAEGGEVHPGADDNASGVAVLLELAAARLQAPGRRTVLFAFTSGEERGLMGSKHLLQSVDPVGCIALDTVGRLDDGKVLVLDAQSAYEWPHAFRGIGFTTGAPIAVSKEPLDASDHGACLAKGIPGVQLTTGPTPDYHRPSDTFDKLDAQGMSTVLEVAAAAVDWLADRAEPLTAQGERPEQGHPTRAVGERRASLGTVPDFAHDGLGVRVEDVVEGSAAAAAGIQPGDLVVGIGEDKIDGLKAMGAVLRKHAPGDQVEVRIMRDGRRLTLGATLTERK